MAQRKNINDQVKFSHGTDSEANVPISEGLTPEIQLIGGVDSSNVNRIAEVDSTGALKTTATISGDVNVDSTSVDTSGYIGKASGTNGDFITAYASATTITCTTLPSDISSIEADDIVTIVQVATDGSVTNTYSRDDITISSSGTDPTTLTIAGATFVTTDTFVVYTNIAKPTSATTQYTAEETIPTEASDGDTIDAWSDLYGRQITYADNVSLGAKDVNVISSIPNRSVNLTMLNAVTADGESAVINTDGLKSLSFQITSSLITSGADVYIWQSNNNTNWNKIDTRNVTTDDTVGVSFSGISYKYIKAEVDNRVDGTFTVTINGGE